MSTNDIDNPYFTRLKNMEKSKKWLLDQQATRVVDALNKNAFTAKYVDNIQTVCDEILALIPENANVGVGGSMTMRQIGILDKLKKRGNEIFDHWQPDLSPEQVLQIRKSHLTCDVFLTSTNAVTLDGVLVNIDGAGNRAASMMFGPGKAIVVAGINKITNDVTSAIKRIKEIATPLVVKDLGIDLPCATTGFCVECNSIMRACRATVILERKPFFSDINVFLVGENLGF